MRDRRFIAVHRGGPLELTDHRLLTTWGADCAERVVKVADAFTGDDRARGAIKAARSWAVGTTSVGAARQAAFAAHAAAREASNPSAIAAARAAGHAAASAHMADHALKAALYARRAVTAGGGSGENERAWQVARLPEWLRDLIEPA